jgi:hypothetical protein
MLDGIEHEAGRRAGLCGGGIAVIVNAIADFGCSRVYRGIGVVAVTLGGGITISIGIGAGAAGLLAEKEQSEGQYEGRGYSHR